MTKGKSAEEIWARFNIQNDFTRGRSKNKLGKKINAARNHENNFKNIPIYL